LSDSRLVRAAGAHHIDFVIDFQANRAEPKTLNFTVANHHPGKDRQQQEDEEQLFKRFPGKAVEYTELSFAQFANDPKRFYS
jgi:hypothetical protein